MKIGIVSSGTESLGLFSFLNRYNHEYFIYLDSANASYGDKNFSTSLQKAKAGFTRLKNQGVDVIILPPLYELALLTEFSISGQKEEKNLILPFFQTYVQDYVFKYSLVGKLGIFGDPGDLEVAQEMIAQLASFYPPTSEQLATKKFVFPFCFRKKETGVFKHLLTHFSRKSLLTNTTLKHDLRYFKDAAVDTLIPLNYCYFNAEKTISRFLNFRKIRFHTSEKLESIFQAYQLPTSSYTIKIYATDSVFALQREKRLLRMLQRGKQVGIEWIS